MRFALIAVLAAAAVPPVLASSRTDLLEAQAVLEQGVREHPKNAELYLHLGFVYKKLGLVDDAQKAFESAAANDPKEDDAYYMLGLIYEKKGLRDKALEAWKACLASADEAGVRATARQHLHLLEATKP